MRTSVIVPTFQRPQDLTRCLAALKPQTRPADEVWLVVRETDQLTWQLLETLEDRPLHLQTITATSSGVVAAMNLGLEAATGAIIAFTDDDAAPRPDWLERIEKYFLTDGRIGGVGGRDYIVNSAVSVDHISVVGKLQWFGRLIGNHHVGVGQPREVDVLKGVNMSFRRTAIADLRFDGRMRGTGAQANFELAFSLALKRKNWKLIYDPHVAVTHYPAKRFDDDRRNEFSATALRNASHNETIALLEHLSPLRRLVFIVWAILVGTTGVFGFMQWLRFLPASENAATQRLLAGWRGRWDGWQTWRCS